MGKLTIKNLKFRCRHGLHDFERVVGNDFEVDAFFWVDLDQAGESDDISHALDYSLACSAIEEIMNGEPLLLIETLLSRIGDRLMDDFPEVEKLSVSIRKIRPPMETTCEYVEVSDTWKR